MDFNFTTQICTTKEQSERLLALGLKKETADMYYTNASLPFEKDKFHLECKNYLQLQKEVIFQICPFIFIPAWSLHRLIEMMPDCITLKDNDIEEDYNNAALEIHHKAVIYESFMVKIYKFKKETNNLYDNLIDCIQWLIKEGYFNKDYLKE